MKYCMLEHMYGSIQSALQCCDHGLLLNIQYISGWNEVLKDTVSSEEICLKVVRLNRLWLGHTMLDFKISKIIPDFLMGLWSSQVALSMCLSNLFGRRIVLTLAAFLFPLSHLHFILLTFWPTESVQPPTRTCFAVVFLVSYWLNVLRCPGFQRRQERL
jgi:hypothetical protein